jgi:hypothetical protein
LVPVLVTIASVAPKKVDEPVIQRRVACIRVVAKKRHQRALLQA